MVFLKNLIFTVIKIHFFYSQQVFKWFIYHSTQLFETNLMKDILESVAYYSSSLFYLLLLFFKHHHRGQLPDLYIY